mmetsp:Transcript_1428/g.4281  ORF Transcript_1428/g.4281 Transcript_1428/m.4281 type:complete len:104 (-) Transcript_1428:41-352(-)
MMNGAARRLAIFLAALGAVGAFAPVSTTSRRRVDVAIRPGEPGFDPDADAEIEGSGLMYDKGADGRVKPASMTLKEDVPLKEVLAPELWADFGLDPVTGDPVA